MNLTQEEAVALAKRAGVNECGFCTRGRWHNPRTNQRELCPYCDGSGYVARAEDVWLREVANGAATRLEARPREHLGPAGRALMPNVVSLLPRPIEGCRFIDPEDGTCGHPDAYSPECWKDGDDMSDCPMVPSDG